MNETDHEFDKHRAKEFLQKKEQKRKEASENERKILLEQIIFFLKDEFSHTNVEVFLVGSITQPYRFHRRSDLDIVLKNFTGDRFEIWTKIEGKIKRNVEVILYENCHFKEHVENEGLRVL
ncbi:MAG: hypothetical protein WB791_03520 [Waddliaceae bacterium]